MNWDGSLSDTRCSSCNEVLQVELLARSLVHLFCGPTRNRAQGQQLYDLLKFLSEHGWGDGLHIGRHDWVNCGCPVGIEDYCDAIAELSDVPLAALSRMLSSKPSPNAMAQQKTKLAEAVANRRAQNPPDATGREHLYYIIETFPSKTVIDTLIKIPLRFPKFEGHDGLPVTRALNAAIAECKTTAET